MKKFLNAIFILIIISALGFFWYQYDLTLCDKVLKYSIGRFDNNFGISEEQFKKYVASAELPWENILTKEKSQGMNLFKYDPEAKFTVNLIYDKRQRETLEKQKTESGLEAAENFFKSLDAKFNLAKSGYDSNVSNYDSAKAAFDLRAANYEVEVNYWNSKKGVPKAKYNELEAERAALNNKAASLNAEAGELKNLASNLDQAVKERNGAVLDYNRTVERYNQKYGGHLEFDQAEYNGKEINIYQFTDSKSLIMALSHEFGHALSLDHVENSKSIMYYLRDSQNLPATPTPSTEDLAELKRVCRL